MNRFILLTSNVEKVEKLVNFAEKKIAQETTAAFVFIGLGVLGYIVSRIISAKHEDYRDDFGVWIYCISKLFSVLSFGLMMSGLYHVIIHSPDKDTLEALASISETKTIDLNLVAIKETTAERSIGLSTSETKGSVFIVANLKTNTSYESISVQTTDFQYSVKDEAGFTQTFTLKDEYSDVTSADIYTKNVEKDDEAKIIITKKDWVSDKQRELLKKYSDDYYEKDGETQKYPSTERVEIYIPKNSVEYK